MWLQAERRGAILFYLWDKIRGKRTNVVIADGVEYDAKYYMSYIKKQNMNQ